MGYTGGRSAGGGWERRSGQRQQVPGIECGLDVPVAAIDSEYVAAFDEGGSDGHANVGPSSPGELGDLGASMKKENISVSTLGLGLGYNEDLMVQLAGKSGGNHQFIENASELADIFRREFDDVLSVVAQTIDVTVEIPEGIRPVRVLGNSADINGQSVVTRLS